FKRIGNHELSSRLDARSFRYLNQLVLLNADLQLEFDEDASKAPVGTYRIDQLGRALEPKPELGFIALDLHGTPLDELWRIALPAVVVVECRSWGRREYACGQIVADGCRMNNRVDIVFASTPLQ